VAVVGAALVLTAVLWLRTDPIQPGTATTPPPTATGAPVAAADPTRVVLTPTTHPDSSQSFSWLAGDPSHGVGQVQVRASSGGDARTVDAQETGLEIGDRLRHFSATVDDLEPATEYDYRVGLEGSWGPWERFTTAASSDGEFQFVYFGDAQTGLESTWPSVVEQAAATAPDAIGSVHAGDLVNRGENEEWAAWFAGMGASAATRNVLAAPGNHEYIGDSFLRQWKASFEYPRNSPTLATARALAALAQGDTDVARQYAAYFEHWSDIAAETAYFVDYQGVRFITLNASQDDAFLTPPDLPSCDGAECPARFAGELWVRFEAAWLEGVLEDSSSDWTVVTFHQPVFSASTGRDEPVLRAHLVPLFEKYDVDLVLMGHDHVYARGYVDADLVEPGVTDGPVYVVANAGAKYYELAPSDDNVWTRNGATQVRRGEGVSTYQVIDVTPTQITYRSYLAAKTPESSSRREIGDVFDEFTISKSADGRKRVTEGAPD
jgi:hypothetical protein